MTFSKVGVVGCGIMGSGIAEVCALHETDVVVVEANPDALAAGSARIEQSLDRGVQRDKLTEVQRAAALGRLRFTDDMTAFVECEIVVEAVVENEAVKVDVFNRLDEVCKADDVILADGRTAASFRDQRIAELRGSD